MKKNNFLLLISIAFLMITCRPDEFKSFADIISHGGQFEPVSYSQSSQEIGETEDVNGDEVWTCTTERVSIEDALGGENGFSMFSPNADVVFPGNLIQGISLYQASPDEILADRTGGEITISVFNGNEKSSVEVDEITIGKVTTAANTILSGYEDVDVIPANFQFEKSIIHSEKEFAYRAKADYENAWASISGSLDFSGNETYSRMMVKLHQTFYTLIYTPPNRVDDFFADSTSPEDLERFIWPGNPPCYIKSVNYGRIFYMLLESSGSESELKTAVDASFGSLTSEGGGSFESEHFESIDEVNIKIVALGGDATTTFETTGLTKDNLYKLSDILKRATDIRTGFPISYKVQSVQTNEVVAVKLATDYDKRTCYTTSALPPLVLTEHWTGVKDLLGGPVGAMVRLNDIPSGLGDPDPILFFDSLGMKCVYDTGYELTGPYANIKEFYSEYYGVDHDFPFLDIGAGGTYSAYGGSFLNNYTYFINTKGNLAFIGTTTNMSQDAYNISVWPHLEYLFDKGIGAMCKFNNLIMTVDKSGHLYHVEPIAGSSNPDFSALLNGPVYIFTGGYENGEISQNKFENGISAITSLGEDLVATVDKDGIRYMVADISNTSYIQYYGPFKL